MAEESLLIASSSIDTGIGCWNLQSGIERLRYKTCASPSHGLICLGYNFIASSQARDSQASSGSILFWSWPKAQVEAKSFPEEPINPIVANTEGTYLFGGGVSGYIYLWEIATGKLLRKFRGHYRSVTRLIFNEDESLIVSGSDDGAIKVWPLFAIFDDESKDQISYMHLHNFSEHMEGINDIAVGFGGSNSIIVSSSKDRTCKIWSMSRGTMLRSIKFPSEITSVVLDPGEHIFYAGSVDGKIYIASLHADFSSSKTQWPYIIGSFSSQSKVTCLGYGFYENLLLSGSTDGAVRAWDPVKRSVVRVFKLGNGPISNLKVVRNPQLTNVHSNSRKQGPLLLPLSKYVTFNDEKVACDALVDLKDTYCSPAYDECTSARMLHNQVIQLQYNGSVSELEVERLKAESSYSNQMLQKWMAMFDNLHEFCVTEILDGRNN